MDSASQLDSLASRDALVRRLARRLIEDAHRAEDAAQATWVAALERGGADPGGGWMAGTLRRVWGKMARTDVRRERREEDAARPEHVDPASEVLEREETRRQLFEALDGLDEPYRACLLLRYFEGLPPRAIARRLGLPVDTVKTRLKRGLGLLRARLERRFDGGDWTLALLPLAGSWMRWAPASPLTSIKGIAIMSTPAKLTLAAGALVLGAWLCLSIGLGSDQPRPVVERSAETAAVSPRGLEEDATRIAETEDGPSRAAVARAEEPTPAPTAAAAPRTGAVEVTVRSEGGEVVAGVPVVLGPRDTASTASKVARSGEDGVARFDDLRPEAVRIWSGQGGWARAEVVADEVARVELVLEDTLRVVGRVVGPTGTPIPGAQVWLVSRRTDWLGTLPVARCDENGEFRLDHVTRDRALGASAPGYGPSDLLELRLFQAGPEPADVELALGAEGGELTGRVVASDGEPVAGARVAIGRPQQQRLMTLGGGDGHSWTPRTTVTDEEGAFSFGGLSAEALELHVAAEGYARATREVTIAPQMLQHVDVQVTRGARVRGVVTDTDGAAVAGAIVMQLDGPFRDPFPSQGPTDPGRPFRRPMTRSDADGAFELAGLPGGTVHLYASKGTSMWTTTEPTVDLIRGKQFVGSAQVELEALADGDLAWDPVLTLGLGIRGVARFADGTPMAHRFIVAKDEEGGWASSSVIDDDGSFEIRGLEDRPYLLSVQVHDLPLGAKPVELEGIYPSPAEVLLMADFVPAVREEPAVVHVRIADGANRIDGLPGVVIQTEDGTWYHPDEKGGVWSCEVAPGRMRARAMNDGELVGVGPWLDVAPGEDRDLGEVVTSPACAVLVRVRRPEGAEDQTVWVSIGTDDAPKRGAEELAAGQDEVLFEDELEGDATVTVSGRGFVRQSRDVLLRPGQARVAFDLERAAACRVRLDAPPDQRVGFGELHLTLRHPDGSVYLETMWAERWGGEIPVELTLSVPVGTLDATATTSTGLEATGTISTEALTDEAELALDLE